MFVLSIAETPERQETESEVKKTTDSGGKTPQGPKDYSGTTPVAKRGEDAAAVEATLANKETGGNAAGTEQARRKDTRGR